MTQPSLDVPAHVGAHPRPPRSVRLLRATLAALVTASIVLTPAAGVAAADPGLTQPAPPPDPATPLPATAPTPNTDACPHKTTPAPPVDTSEAVPPGQQPPAPLPVPPTPAGGDKLAQCGVVVADGAPPPPPNISAAGFLVSDMHSGKVLLAKDPHGRYRPASTIKVLLAIVALRELDLDATVEATEQDYGMEGDAAGMGPGGKYTNRQLLEGLLLVSGNDCANALARELGGYDVAVGKMNAVAKELGANDTRAASPSGLDAPGMSTSPYDETVILREAMGNDEFRRITALQDAFFPGYPPNPQVPGDVPHPGYLMANQNQLLASYPGAIGGKTGFTDDARKTYVGVATRDGRTLIVTMMYGWNLAGYSYFQQAASLLDYGFALDPAKSVGDLPSSTHGAQHEQDRGTTSSAPSVGVIIAAGGGLLVVALLVAAAVVQRRQRR